LTNNQPSSSLSTKGLLNLIVVYLAWGSTYLFIRVAVREGSGFPPFAMAASRTLCAAVILFATAALLGHEVRRPASELRLLALSGFLLWVGGNGMVTWAEHHANSGYAALIVGSTPIWPVIMEAIIDREPPSALLVLSLVIGFIGLAVLVRPVLHDGIPADVASTVALLIAAVSWSGGSLLLQRSPPQCTPLVISGYQQFFGGLGLAAAMVLTGEPRPLPSPSAWLGWGYLLTVGSLISFTSYVIAVRTLPIAVVTTYAYVNPVIAVLLGWLVLGEQITSGMLIGMALILASVAGVFRQRLGRRARLPAEIGSVRDD
jgi:drug/metabolite transporter (DMT)-like permease